MSKQNLWECSFEFIKHQQKRRAEVVTLLLEPKRNDVVLDVGCHEGYIMSFFAGQAGFVVGLDVSLDAIKIAKSKLNASNLDFCRGDASKLPFRPSCFDKMTVLEVLEHLPNLEMSVEEIDRCAKENAVLVISLPWKEKIPHLPARMPHKETGRLVPRWGHLHSFDDADIASLLPSYYALIIKKHLPNTYIHLITWLPVLRHLPLRNWLRINDILGKIRKGYWVICKFKKVASQVNKLPARAKNGARIDEQEN